MGLRNSRHENIDKNKKTYQDIIDFLEVRLWKDSSAKNPENLSDLLNFDIKKDIPTEKETETYNPMIDKYLALKTTAYVWYLLEHKEKGTYVVLPDLNSLQQVDEYLKKRTDQELGGFEKRINKARNMIQYRKNVKKRSESNPHLAKAIKYLEYMIEYSKYNKYKYENRFEGDYITIELNGRKVHIYSRKYAKSVIEGQKTGPYYHIIEKPKAVKHNPKLIDNN